MSRLSFGVELHPYHDAATVMSEVEAAEKLGYDHLWLGDSQLIWRELYVLLGAAARSTSGIHLGSGVTNPITRHAAVTASAAATLQELSGGRMILGVGAGDSSVRTMGMKPSPVTELEDFILLVKGLCRGEPVQGPGGEMRLAFGSPRLVLPVVVGATGPRMLRLAGRVADGVILGGGAARGEVVEKMLACVREGRRSSPEPARRFRVFASLPACVHPDRDRALAAVRPHVARSLLKPQWGLSPAAEGIRERVARAYDYNQHMNPEARHARLIPDQVVPEFALAGTAGECIRQATRIFELGADQITIRPYAAAGGTRLQAIRDFAEQVLGPLQET